MKSKYWLNAAMMVSLGFATPASAERAEVIEYNPNIQTSPPVVQPAAPTSEIGVLGYVNEKFNRMDRQLEDSADRMDRLERDISRMRALEIKIADLEKKIALLSAVAASSAPVSDSVKDGVKSNVPALSASELEAAQSAYKKAFDQLMAGKYPEAGKLFKEYLDKYPQTDQSSNAHYWLGETHFVGRKFDLALKSYTEASKLEGPKVSDALLKQGMCYIELKKDKEAKAIFEQLKKEFPETSAAKQADKQLSSIKK
jgi:tol-pal system protein YbgF